MAEDLRGGRARKSRTNSCCRGAHLRGVQRTVLSSQQQPLVGVPVVRADRRAQNLVRVVECVHQGNCVGSGTTMTGCVKTQAEGSHKKDEHCLGS